MNYVLLDVVKLFFKYYPSTKIHNSFFVYLLQSLHGNNLKKRERKMCMKIKIQFNFHFLSK